MRRHIRAFLGQLIEKGLDLHAKHAERLYVQELAFRIKTETIAREASDSPELMTRMRRLLEANGISFRSKDSIVLEVLVMQHLGMSYADLQTKPNGSVDKPFGIFTAFKQWMDCNEDLVLAHEESVSLYGNEILKLERTIRNGIEVPNRRTYFLRFKSSPLLVDVRVRRDDLEVMVRGECAAEFLKELDSRLNEHYIKELKGKTLNHQLQEITLRTFTREELVYPTALGKKVDALLTCFHNWSTRDRIHRWGYALIGAPGTGKTTIGGLIAGVRPEGCTFLYCPAGEIQDARQLNAVFSMAQLLAPTVLQIDDIDLISGDRQGDDDNELTSALMENLDGLSAEAKIFALFTTNNPSGIEQAIIDRPGRIQDKIVFEGYGECFAQLLFRLMNEYGLVVSESVVQTVVGRLKELTSVFTPDEVKNVCQRLSLSLADDSILTEEDLEQAIRSTHKAFHDSKLKESRLQPVRRKKQNSSEGYPD